MNQNPKPAANVHALAVIRRGRRKKKKKQKKTWQVKVNAFLKVDTP